MKKLNTLLIILFAGLFSLQAQESNIINTPLENFDELNIRGNVYVNYTQGDECRITATLPNDASDILKYKVSNGILFLDTKKSKTIKVDVISKQIKAVDIASVSEFHTNSQVQVNTLKIKAAGASIVEVDVKCQYLELMFEGASDAKISGKTSTLKNVLQGAASINAKDLHAEDVKITASGASEIDLNASRSIDIVADGASDITFSGDPEIVEIQLDGIASVNNKNLIENMIIIEGGDTVAIGSKRIIIQDEDIDVDEKEDKFNGHWGGLDFAFNSFLSPDYELNVAPSNDFMDIEFSRSWGIELNLIEQNFNLINNHLGLVTGLGLHISNYRLDNNVRLINDSATLMSWTDTTSNTIRSKLVTSYLMLPLMLEYQSNGKNNTNSFHIGIGGFIGTRIGSHTKVVIDNSNGKDKIKSYNTFHLNPFKYGLMARVGWGRINLFANYSMSTMFDKNEGPEVYPLEFGITIVGW